jgi:hypothetical protein
MSGVTGRPAFMRTIARPTVVVGKGGRGKRPTPRATRDPPRSKHEPLAVATQVDRCQRAHDSPLCAPLTFARSCTRAERVVADSVPYLVHFPDGHKAVHNIEIGRVAGVGTELLDGWVVDEIKQIDETIDEKSVTYEVWVRPRLTH